MCEMHCTEGTIPGRFSQIVEKTKSTKTFYHEINLRSNIEDIPGTKQLASFPGLSPRLISQDTASDKSLGDKPGNEASKQLVLDRIIIIPWSSLCKAI